MRERTTCTKEKENTRQQLNVYGSYDGHCSE
jgi:hypothetical protein